MSFLRTPDSLARACEDVATFRRTMTMTTVDPDRLVLLLGAYFHTATTQIGGRRVIALEGKTVRGARARTGADLSGTDAAPHPVAAFDRRSGIVLGQVAVAAKSNEIQGARGRSPAVAAVHDVLDRGLRRGPLPSDGEGDRGGSPLPDHHDAADHRFTPPWDQELCPVSHDAERAWPGMSSRSHRPFRPSSDGPCSRLLRRCG